MQGEKGDLTEKNGCESSKRLTMTVAIIGVGLIGGSLGISLQENGFADDVLGVDLQSENLDKALRRRLIREAVSLDEAIERADLLILAIPVDGLYDLLPQVLHRISPRQVVTEVGSTKDVLLESLKDHPHRGRLVAAHPMAGTEHSGPEAAIPNLFAHKAAVIVDREDSDRDALARVEDLYRSLAMQLVYLERKAHDIHAAYVSHISHISSFALALTVLAKETDEDRIFELASAGFDSTVRLASSSPDMWVPIFRQNREHVLDVLDEHINQLARFRTLLIKKDYERFYGLIREANQIKKILHTDKPHEP